MQLDHGVATVLYATVMDTFDGQAAHTHGGDEDTDAGGAEWGAGSAMVYSLGDKTVANSSEQTEQTLTAEDIRSVPTLPMGHSASGPQIPKGKAPM